MSGYRVRRTYDGNRVMDDRYALVPSGTAWSHCALFWDDGVLVGAFGT